MIQIKVFANEVCFKENRHVYECIVHSCDCDSNSLISSFRFLYGKGCVITFNFLPL